MFRIVRLSRAAALLLGVTATLAAHINPAIKILKNCYWKQHQC